MSKTLYAGDTHLGHRGITKYRDQFASAEEHDTYILEQLHSTVSKRDTLVMMGDTTFTLEALQQVAKIKCKKKILVLGNHCTEKRLVPAYCDVYDEIHSMYSARKVWHSHCPIHPSQFRERILNIHAHLHEDIIDDPRYFSVSMERINYTPISFQEIMERT